MIHFIIKEDFSVYQIRPRQSGRLNAFSIKQENLEIQREFCQQIEKIPEIKKILR